MTLSFWQMTGFLLEDTVGEVGSGLTRTVTASDETEAQPFVSLTVRE